MISALTLLLSLSVNVAIAAAATAPDITELVAQAATYQSGQSTEPLRQLERLSADATTDPTLRAKLEAGLIQLLAATTTFEARMFACEQLARVGSETAVPSLAALLGDPETVAMACLALRSNPSSKADAALRDALSTARGEPRQQIIHTVGNRKDRQAVPLLTELARDAHLTTAEAAIIALGKIPDPTARKSLSALRSQAEPSVLNALDEAMLQSAENLVATGMTSEASDIYESLLTSASAAHTRRGALEALFALDQDAGEARILAVLRDSDADLKPLAISRIIALPHPRVSKRFGSELPELELHEQVLLVEALAARADASALEILRAEVTNQNEPVRVAAVQALGKSGGASDVPLLAQALSNAITLPERLVIERILVAMEGGEATDQGLIKALQPAPPAAKPHIMSALAQRRSRPAIPALIEESGSPIPAVARAAFQALSRLVNGTEAPALLERLDNLNAAAARPEAESAVVRALLQVESAERRWDLLRPRLEQTHDLETRLSLLRLLPHAPDPNALQALEAAIDDSHPQVADTALRALAEWPDANAWDVLAQVYRGDPAEPHRVLALRGLVRLAQESGAQSDAGLFQRYGQLIRGAKRDEDLKLILGALGSVAHPDALPLAQAQLGNPAVRIEAELAVRQIAELIKKQHPDLAQAALNKLQD